MSENPIPIFIQRWQTALQDSPLQQKNAVCVSTINEDGFPDGRFVDLKQVDDAGFIFCTDLDSQKGHDIRNNDKVAITAWWDHVGYQIRITGRASQIDEELATIFWQTRSRSAQLTTSCFTQGLPIADAEAVTQKFTDFADKNSEKTIAKPLNWGGYRVTPQIIEFLTFKESRLHLREKFTRTKNLTGQITLTGQDNDWQKQILQP